MNWQIFLIGHGPLYCPSLAGTLTWSQHKAVTATWLANPYNVTSTLPHLKCGRTVRK